MTNKQALRGLSVEAHFYLAECCNCGEVMPSSKLIESRNYMDGDADCYCPHCNADDCDIADMGSAASESWNYQQKRIEALLDELEAKDKAWSAQDNHINQQADRIESLEKKNGELGIALGAAEERIAELESREVTPEVGVMNIGKPYCEDRLVAWTVAGKSLPPGIYYLEAVRSGSIGAED